MLVRKELLKPMLGKDRGINSPVRKMKKIKMKRRENKRIVLLKFLVVTNYMRIVLVMSFSFCRNS